MNKSQPTILLLPGMDGTGRLFRWLIPEIQSFAMPVTIAYPGDRFLNYSELADYVAGQIPAGPYVILAESFSGPVAVALAAKKHSGLRAVILSTSFIAPPAPSWLKIAPLRMLFRARVPKLLLRWLLLDSTCDAEIVAEVADAVGEVCPAVLAARFREILTADAGDALRSCHVPVLYLAASRDRLIGRRGLRTIQRVRPDIETVTLEGPHLLLQAQPRAAAHAIKTFLDRCVE